MTIESLLRKIQSEINKIWKLDPDKVDTITYKQYLDKARVMGYLCSVGGQLLEKHDLEKRLERLEEELGKIEQSRRVA
jgi:transcription initiation factor IIE alpha subunit